MTFRRIQPHIVSLAIVFGLWLLLCPRTAVLQTNCQPPGNPSQYAWPKDAQVQVNIDPSFSTAQKVSRPLSKTGTVRTVLVEITLA